jgi:arginine decarboxylase
VPAPEKAKPEWDIDAAISTYNVDAWGSGYFSINAAGNVVAKPLKDAGGAIDLLEVVNEARERGLGFPLVIRFQDLLRHRVGTVNRLPTRDAGIRLSQRVPRRFSDQGQPAARGD